MWSRRVERQFLIDSLPVIVVAEIRALASDVRGRHLCQSESQRATARYVHDLEPAFEAARMAGFGRRLLVRPLCDDQRRWQVVHNYDHWLKRKPAPPTLFSAA